MCSRGRMGTTDSRADGAAGGGQERRNERPGRHTAAEPPRSEEEEAGARHDKSRQGPARVLAGQSDGSPVDAERPTWSEGQVPDAAQPLAGGHKRDQVMKSVGTQTYKDDKTRALADLPEHSTTGTTGTLYGQPGMSEYRHGEVGSLTSQSKPPVQDTCPHVMPHEIYTTGRARAGFASHYSPVLPPGNPPAQAAFRELQQTRRKEAHTAAGAIGGNVKPSDTGEDRHASTVDNTGFRTETEMDPMVRIDDTPIGGHDTLGTDGRQGPRQGEEPGADNTQVSVRRQVDETGNERQGRVAAVRQGGKPAPDDEQGQFLIGRQGSEQRAEERQGPLLVGRRGRQQEADDRQGQVPTGTQGSEQGVDRRQGQLRIGRQGSEQGADDRQGQVPIGRLGSEQGADDRQGQVPIGRQGSEQGVDRRQGQAPIGRQGSEHGVDRRQGQVLVETPRDTNNATRPPERGEGGRTSVETQTGCEENNAERCSASVRLLLDTTGDDAQTVEHKEHIIHEMSQGSNQVFQYKTAYGLALHVLEQKTWKVDKIWSSHCANSNMSEVGVLNVLKELDQHNKKIGHIVEYFTLEFSKRLDIIRLIQKIHDKCDFCETIYNSVT